MEALAFISMIAIITMIGLALAYPTTTMEAIAIEQWKQNAIITMTMEAQKLKQTKNKNKTKKKKQNAIAIATMETLGLA